MALDEPDRPTKLGAGLFFALIGDHESTWNAAVEYLKEHAQPEEIFDNDKLEAWARARGFKLEQ